MTTKDNCLVPRKKGTMIGAEKGKRTAGHIGWSSNIAAKIEDQQSSNWCGGHFNTSKSAVQVPATKHKWLRCWLVEDVEKGVQGVTVTFHLLPTLTFRKNRGK
jgi:hypothetical protein